MKFEEALAAMREGKLVRRKYWRSTVGMKVGKLHSWGRIGFLFVDGDMERPTFTVSDSDILAEDWEIVEGGK